MENTFPIFIRILSYSVFILLAPIASFFVSKIVLFEGILHLNAVSANVWSAVVAVVVLHIAAGLYIYRAYFDAEKSKPEDKID